MAAVDAGVIVPVWTIGTEASKVAHQVDAVVPSGGFTAERLAQLRDGLATLMDTPLVSLEAYPLPVNNKIAGGRLLDAASPLALSLTSLIQHSSQSLRSAAPSVSLGGETLYRMVVPARVAAQMGSGLVRSMPSTAAATGIYSGVLGKAGIVGHSTFVPVAAKVAVTGAVGLVVTVAPPLILMAIAIAVTIYFEEQRLRALERITKLLHELKQSHLDDKRDALEASSKAIDKAAAVLLDEGKIGISLGLDSAVHRIDTAIEAAIRLAEGWRSELDSFGDSGATEEDLKKAYPGIDGDAGEFRSQLRMAAFAIATKRRVAVLQAVEHAQQAPELTFSRFASALRADQKRVDDLERDLTAFLTSLARVQILPPDGLTSRVMTRAEVRDLLKLPTRLRELADSETPAYGDPNTDLEIAMIRHADGRVRVLALAPAA